MVNRCWGLGFVAAAVLGLAAPAQAVEIPPCAGEVEVANAHVNRVEKNAAIVLDDGRAAMPEGLRLPHGAVDHAPDFLADQALATLKEFTRGRAVDFAVHKPEQDRYDRIRAQVFFSDAEQDTWLQLAMLRRGLARVQIAPDRPECAAELYGAEREARQNRYGLWISPAYAIRTPANLAGDIGTFQIVEGAVVQATEVGGRAYLNFGSDWQTDFTVSISPDDMKNFDAAGIDPRDYQGKTIRVRGIVQQLNGPEIEIAVPQQIESVTAWQPPKTP